MIALKWQPSRRLGLGRGRILRPARRQHAPAQAVTRASRAAYWLCLTLCLTGCLPEEASTLPTKAEGLSLIELTIGDAHNALRRRAISCEQLTERFLARIEAYDPPPAASTSGAETVAGLAHAPPASSQTTAKLNAIILTNPNALMRARALDGEYETLGRMRRLHCIPVIVKDNFDTTDMPTAAGSTVLRTSMPPDDAYMVRRLREAGAIVLAKSNMGEWAFSPYRTISGTHGETRNAYDLTRVPAGSSGGTASAIAANLGVIGLGTDTGNSIRGPSSHLALVGIRSTLGATSRDGIVPLLANRDVGGPMLRNVRDTATVFSVLAGHDPADPLTRTALGRTSTDYSRFLDRNGLRGVRLGVLRALVDTETTDPEVKGTFERALSDLADAGAVLVDPFVIPDLERLTEATGFCSRFRHDLARYLESLGPAAPVKTLDEIVVEEDFLARHADAMAWAMRVSVRPEQQEPPCIDVEGDPRRKALLDAVVAAMDADEVQALIYPSWNNPPRRIGDDDSPHGNNSPIIAPHSGQPAITVPMGFTGEGLPLGLQLLARPFDEHKLFRYAYAYEQQTRHRRPPPGFGELPLD